MLACARIFPMQIPVFYIDAFTTKVFSGNPAAVCPLQAWLSDELMQKIAAENNLSESAFFVPRGGGFELRWFTPTVEVDLCGHATLASAFVLFERLGFSQEKILFHTKSGDLTVTREGLKFSMDFPGRNVDLCQPSQELLANFANPPKEVLKSGSGTYIVVLNSEDDVQNFQPDFQKLAKVDRCVNITAPGRECDFVSRFFGPNIGIPEDPVTGSVHCGLAIYWSARLKRSDRLYAIQLSARTGEVYCQVIGDRVLLTGSAVAYMEGQIRI